MTKGEKARFATKVQALVKAEQNASQLRGIRNETIVARTTAFRKGTTSREAGNIHEHIVRIDEAIGGADQNVEAAGKQVDVARGKLVERRRDQKAVELLRDRRFRSWLKDYYRDKGKTLDDIATIKYVKKEE